MVDDKGSSPEPVMVNGEHKKNEDTPPSTVTDESMTSLKPETELKITMSNGHVSETESEKKPLEEDEEMVKPENKPESDQSPIKSSNTETEVKKTEINGKTPSGGTKKPEKENDEDEELKEKSQFSWGVFFIKFFIILYDILTFPLFYLIQNPREKIRKSREVRAVLENPEDPYSSYVRVANNFNNHFVFKAQTIPEAQQLAVRFNRRTFRSMGYRRILGVVNETTKSGKIFKKYRLTDYEWITIGDVDERIGQLARGFTANGVKYQQAVLMLSETRMEWQLCCQALFRIGAVVTTLYTTLGKKSICHGINESEVEHIVTTTDMLPMLLEMIEDTPKVKQIYVIEIHPDLIKGEPITEMDFNKKLEQQNRKISMMTYEHLRELGDLNPKIEHYTPKPEDVALILYTSGSTGNPKGVEITHKNMIASIHSVFSILNQDIVDDYDEHVYYAVLPLSHIFEMALELSFISIGIPMGYGSTFTMMDNSTAIMRGHRGDLRLLRPTIIAGVPLLLDRVRRGVTEPFLRKNSIFWKQLIKFSVAYKNYWLERGFDTPLTNRLICKPINKILGGNLQYVISGGAPLSPDTQRMMRAFLNVKLLVGYGSTEISCAATMMDFDDLSVGYIGAPLYGIKLRLIDWPEGGYSVHDKPNPRGELVVGGPNVSKGYFKLPDKTAEAYEEINGVRWFKMGDIGEVTEIGTFKIIDRKKDLVKLQFGEYISLGKVEAEIKNFRYCENVCVYGDSMHNYTLAFILPSFPALKLLAKEMGKNNLITNEQICNDPEIIAKVQDELRKFCLEAGLHKMEIPQRIKLCWEEWSQQNGLLTASLKINRRNIQKRYEDEIKKLYES